MINRAITSTLPDDLFSKLEAQCGGPDQTKVAIVTAALDDRIHQSDDLCTDPDHQQIITDHQHLLDRDGRTGSSGRRRRDSPHSQPPRQPATVWYHDEDDPGRAGSPAPIRSFGSRYPRITLRPSPFATPSTWRLMPGNRR